jgi:FlaA1/EpsC-like NDP-sugar epimerase
MFNNKTLLITGGTGTVGNAVVSRFLEMLKTLDLVQKELEIWGRGGRVAGRQA